MGSCWSHPPAVPCVSVATHAMMSLVPRVRHARWWRWTVRMSTAPLCLHVSIHQVYSFNDTVWIVFFLSFNLLIGWQLSIWNCCKPFFSLLDCITLKLRASVCGFFVALKLRQWYAKVSIQSDFTVISIQFVMLLEVQEHTFLYHVISHPFPSYLKPLIYTLKKWAMFCLQRRQFLMWKGS